MGSCGFYMKADFPTNTDASKAEVELKKFFTEAAKAYYDETVCQHDKTFAKKYPLVTEYLKHTKQWKDNHAQLDFGQDEDEEVIVVGTQIGWYGREVGHLGSWHDLCIYVMKKHGAIRADWNNEEDSGIGFDTINLYPWEQIVRDILDNEAVRPLLIGISKDLDELLERKVKNAGK